jgi:hypothetical protein
MLVPSLTEAMPSTTQSHYSPLLAYAVSVLPHPAADFPFLSIGRIVMVSRVPGSQAMAIRSSTKPIP